jgi:hypothetical protein
MATKSRIRTTVISVVVAGLLCSAPLLAGQQTALIPGAYHLMRVDEVGKRANAAPTGLRWTTIGTKGEKLGGMIPGTEGAGFDAYPWLFNDPESGMPALVWSHHNGVDYDLALTRFDGEGWSDPLTLVSTEMDEIQPRAYAAPGEGFHLVWNGPGKRRGFHYGLFRLDTGIAIVGPENVIPVVGPRDNPQWTPEGGLDDPGTGLSSDCETDAAGNCRCHRPSGMCITSPGEEGATVCDSISLVVGSGSDVCILTRTGEGWLTGACQPSKGGAGARQLLQSLEKIQGSSCP